MVGVSELIVYFVAILLLLQRSLGLERIKLTFEDEEAGVRIKFDGNQLLKEASELGIRTRVIMRVYF